MLLDIEESISSSTRCRIELHRACSFNYYSVLVLSVCRSLVAFGTKQRFVGESAKTQETSNFKNTIGSLKRLIGRTLDDPQVQEKEKKFINTNLIDVNGSVGAEVRTASSCTKFFFCSSDRRLSTVARLHRYRGLK